MPNYSMLSYESFTLKNAISTYALLSIVTLL